MNNKLKNTRKFYLARSIFFMKKCFNSPFILLPLLGIMFFACEDNNGRFNVEPPRDLSTQLEDDNDSINKFLDMHFFNYEEYAAAESDEYVEFTFDTIQGEFADKIPMRDFFQEHTVELKDADDNLVSHTMYYHIPKQGVIDASPTLADSVYVTYKGMLLSDVTFDMRTDPIWFDNLALVRGFREFMPKLKRGFFTDNGDGTYNSDGFGRGIVIFPSALGYYNSTSSGIPAYSSLIFSVELYTFNENTDHDNDSVPSYLEDVNGDGVFDDDTDEDNVVNVFDNDDDGDDILTIDEYILDNDGFPMDSDNDGTPDYLDAD